MEKRTKFIFLTLLSAVQLIFLGDIMFDYETLAMKGRIYKFEIAPIDPNDPFRGKYINLSFEADDFPGPYPKNFMEQSTLCLAISEDAEGFAYVSSVSNDVPKKGDYIRINSDQIHKSYGREKGLHIDFPFERFYIEENKASRAEQSLRQRAIEGEVLQAYAEIAISQGKAGLIDVKLNDVPLNIWLDP